MSDTTQDQPAELRKLDDTYDIRAELFRIGDTPTYLARHRELGRDVTITVVHVPGGGENNTLTHFASDARLLASLRHPNIIPVLEGRWLDADTFAVVRARVRGSALEQVLTAVGQMPIPRVGDTLEAVNEAITWARANGIVHRRVSAESLVFQQPTGRVMLALEPVMLEADALPDACDDTRTLGTLAWEMLTGRRYDPQDPPSESLNSLRPELPPMVAAETEHMLHCQAGEDATDIPSYLAALTGAATAPIARNPVEARPQPATPTAAVETPRTEATQRDEAGDQHKTEDAALAAAAGAVAAEAIERTRKDAPREIVPPVKERVVATPVSREPPPVPVAPTSVESAADERPVTDDVPIARDVATASAAAPVVAGAAAGGDGDAVVVEQRSGMGFNGKMMAAVALAAVLLIVAAFVVHSREGQRPRIDANAPLADTSNAAAGDVALTTPQMPIAAPNTTTVQPPVPATPYPGVAPGAPVPGAAMPNAALPGTTAGAPQVSGGTAVTPGTVSPIMPASPTTSTTTPAPRRTTTAPRSTPTRSPVADTSPTTSTTSSTPSTTSPTTTAPATQPPKSPDTTASNPTPTSVPKVDLPPLTTIRQPAKKDSTVKKDTTIKHDTTATSGIGR